VTDPHDDLPIAPDEVLDDAVDDPFDIDGPDDEQAEAFASLFGGGGAGGGLDFGALLETAGQMQAQLLAAQEQAAATVVEGVSGGGAVRIAVTGGFEFQSVTIAPDAVDPDDVEMLQDLILAALNDAAARAAELARPDLGGMDLGGMDLGGLLGGA
jgi:DNA-binding YbaB/EbfC family protein